MKLLFFIESMDGGGAERVMAIVTRALSARGHSIYLATNLSKKFAYQTDESINLININAGCPNPKSSYVNLISFYYHRWKNYRSIAKKISPDLVVSFQVWMNHDVVLSLLGTHIPVICSEHTNLKRNHTRKTILFRSIAYPLANCITVLTKADYNIFKHSYHNLVHMPNPCSITPTKTSHTREKIVLAAGRLSLWEIKGFDILIRCWAKLCKSYKDWKLYIAGDGDKNSLNQINKMISKYGCLNIELLGFRSDIKQLMETSSIFCLPSRTEGLPMVLIEAMDAECCCIAANCYTGPNEIIKDNISGLLTKVDCDEDFIDKLRLVMSNKTIRDSLASNSKSSIRKYDESRIIDRWELLFNKILKSHIQLI